MVIEVGAEVGSGTPVLGTLARVLVVRLGPMGTLTQVLNVGLGGRGTRRCAVAARSVRIRPPDPTRPSFATNCEDTPSRPHATTTPYDPSPPRRATTTHVTTQVKTLWSPIALYSIQNL